MQDRYNRSRIPIFRSYPLHIYVHRHRSLLPGRKRSQCLDNVHSKLSSPSRHNRRVAWNRQQRYISFSEESTEIILSGFTDRKIIIISIYLNLTEDSLETESQILYSKYFSSPITATCNFNYCNINYLLLGEQKGNVFIKKQSQFKYILLKIINDHTQ